MNTSNAAAPVTEGGRVDMANELDFEERPQTAWTGKRLALVITGLACALVLAIGAAIAAVAGVVASTPPPEPELYGETTDCDNAPDETACQKQLKLEVESWFQLELPDNATVVSTNTSAMLDPKRSAAIVLPAGVPSPIEAHPEAFGPLSPVPPNTELAALFIQRQMTDVLLASINRDGDSYGATQATQRDGTTVLFLRADY